MRKGQSHVRNTSQNEMNNKSEIKNLKSDDCLNSWNKQNSVLFSKIVFVIKVAETL